MNNIKISKMTIEDYKEIKDILISEFDDFWTPEILETELTGENKIYIVAKESNKIIGFAGILINFDEAEIMNIVVKKSNRRNGIGTLLLHRIIDIVKEKNVRKIFLEVNENNRNAIILYKNNGFEMTGIRKKYYKSTDDAIIMSKNINIL